jgi:hypothetical protein
MNKRQARAIALDIAASLVESSTHNDGAIAIVFSEHPDISQKDANKVIDELTEIVRQLRDQLKYLPDMKSAS